MCFDAKVNFDDNAEFRQDEVFAMRDTQEEDPREVCQDDVGRRWFHLDDSIPFGFCFGSRYSKASLHDAG